MHRSLQLQYNMSSPITKLSKDELSYILIDSAIGLYRKPISEHLSTNIYWGSSIDASEWKYFSRMRLVSKQWKKMVDKYIYRYIYANSLSDSTLIKKLCYDSKVITTVKYPKVGQKYQCRITAINSENIKMYSSFLYGLFHISINYRMVRKSNYKPNRLNNKAIVTIHLKTEFDDPFHKTYSSYPKTIKYYWKKKGNVKDEKVNKGWKKVIAEHLMKYIVKKITYNNAL